MLILKKKSVLKVVLKQNMFSNKDKMELGILSIKSLVMQSLTEPSLPSTFCN